MTPETETATRNHCPIETLINNLLAERNEMLALFCKLAGLEPFHHDKPISKELEEFCEILMDYLSAGHFEAYERILNEDSPHHQEVLALAEEIFPKILNTTDVALSFNDKYESEDSVQSHRQDLSGDLSQLIASVATRIDLEDRLINALHLIK